MTRLMSIALGIGLGLVVTARPQPPAAPATAVFPYSVRTEADRFINLAYSEDTLRTEASVIEGEYYASASDPDRRLFETLRDTAYEKHSYKHTTLGFLKDIRDMPNQYEYRLLYKKRFYAPDNTILLVAGDYDPRQLAAFAPASPLCQKLVNIDQTCRSLSADFADTRDPSLLVITAVVKNDADLPGVEAEILKELERAKAEPGPDAKLADIKSRRKYALARSLETTDGVAGTLAFYLNLTGDMGTLNRLFDLYDKVTPRDIQDAARKYFKPSNGTVVTLTGGTAK